MDYKTEILANKAGDELVQNLIEATGLPWKKRVWQNMGWFACANLQQENGGGFSVSEDWRSKDSIFQTFSCYASPDSLGGHIAYFGPVPRGKSPNEAFQCALNQIQEHYGKIYNFILFAHAKEINPDEVFEEHIKKLTKKETAKLLHELAEKLENGE